MELGNPLSPLMLGQQIRRSSAEVFYSPSFMPPLSSQMPFVFTIHDLMHLFYYSKLHGLYYRYVIAGVAKKAKQIITVSHTSKQQLIEHLHLDERLISVVYNGVDNAFFQNKEKAQLDRPYFLYVGNRRSYKNIPAMLTAFATASLADDFIFALSGNPDSELSAHIEKLGIAKRVRYLGFIEEADLPKMSKGAYATMFASLMEGFGLPLLESMASGTPVLTSSVSSLTELARGAAFCADPTSVEEMAVGMERLVNDTSFYNHCVGEGEKRASQFTWEACARKTWELILT
jgi:glycosyltransferase involved in cell wall biosynthesis